jgi:hypothetical protein
VLVLVLVVVGQRMMHDGPTPSLNGEDYSNPAFTMRRVMRAIMGYQSFIYF